MNGLIRRAALGTCLGATVAILAGCVPEYRELVDPCWPERYNYQARHSVREAFNAQAANGHALDQTIWTEYFDVKNNTQLNQLGRDRLKAIALRRPAPDPTVFVQKTYDEDLNNKRAETVKLELQKLRDLHGRLPEFNVVSRMTSEIGLVPSAAAPTMYQKTADQKLKEKQDAAAAGRGAGETAKQ